MTTAPEPSDSGIQLPEEYKDMQLTLAQQFELVKFEHIIDTTPSVDQLRKVSKQLLKAWFTQRAAVNFVLKQKLDQINRETFPEFYAEQSPGA